MDSPNSSTARLTLRFPQLNGSKEMAKKAAKKTATSKKSPAKKNVKKKAPAKKKASKTTKKSANPELKSMDETGRREKAADRRMEEAPVASERRKTTRRRQIDPTTCERCLLYTSPSPRDRQKSRMPSSA